MKNHGPRRTKKNLREGRVKPIIGYYGSWVRLTYLSVISAVVGTYMALTGNIGISVFCLMVCGLCDMFDGTIARMKDRTPSEESYGIQIDALADIVSFGVFPVVIGYAIGALHIFPQRVTMGMIVSITVSAIYILATLIRLAYFNVVEIELADRKEARKYYEGMPVTFVSIIIPLVYAMSLIFGFHLPPVYNVMLFVLAAAFLIRIRIPKIRGRYLLIFLLIGLPIAIYLILNIGMRV